MRLLRNILLWHILKPPVERENNKAGAPFFWDDRHLGRSQCTTRLRPAQKSVRDLDAFGVRVFFNPCGLEIQQLHVLEVAPARVA
jgi:hypothetical protein